MKSISRVLVLLCFFIAIANPSTSSAETGVIISANMLSSADVTGVNDQTLVLLNSLSNTNEVQARVTLDVLNLPLAGQSVTVGTCVINFVNVPGDTVNELNCLDNDVSIDLTIGVGDTVPLVTDLETTISQISNVSDDIHGNLTVSIDEQYVYFRGPLPVSEIGNIAIVALPGDVNLTQTAAVTGVSQLDEYEFSGTVEDGDIIRFLTDNQDFEYEIYGETTWNEVAQNIAWEIEYGDNYNEGLSYYDEPFLVSVGDSESRVINFTGKTTSSSFSFDLFDIINREASYQEVRFSINDAIPQTTYVITINDVEYEYESSIDSTEATIAAGLTTLLSRISGISCTDEGGGIIECAGNVLSTPFTYSVGYFETPRSSSGGSSTRIKRSATTPVVTEVENVLNLREQILLLIAAAEKVGFEIPKALRDYLENIKVRNLTLGSEGDDVKKLQQFLITAASGPKAETLAKSGVTGYFGPFTQAALAEWQAANGIIPASGYFGPLTQAKMKTLALVGIWW